MQLFNFILQIYAGFKLLCKVCAKARFRGKFHDKREFLSKNLALQAAVMPCK